MRNLSKLALSMLATLIASSLFAQCPMGSPCAQRVQANYGGCGSGGCGFNGNSSNYAPRYKDYDAGFSSYGASNDGSYGSPMHSGASYGYSQSHEFPVNPNFGYAQGGYEMGYPNSQPEMNYSSNGYPGAIQRGFEHQPSYSNQPYNQSGRNYNSGNNSDYRMNNPRLNNSSYGMNGSNNGYYSQSSAGKVNNNYSIPEYTHNTTGATSSSTSSTTSDVNK